ncbi:MAG: alpha-L-rhamnosidase N-terminal domain-containing protein, partial [Verrucomicrobia bacterium]|nr:alpha-L-rhamnosidase N-terminal domain-containing protein [Verrucomicrobiota bacterium]
MTLSGQWIGASEARLTDWRGAVLPAPLFRKEFRIPSAVKQARVRLCGLGYQELRLNGSKVGDHVLDPIVTQYDQRVRFVAYDVTDRLQVGDNVLGVMLGNGWY